MRTQSRRQTKSRTRSRTKQSQRYKSQQRRRRSTFGSKLRNKSRTKSKTARTPKWRLVKIIAVRQGPKKWTAVFATQSAAGLPHYKSVSFGARGYEDFTQHHDTKRREKYRTRHQRDRIHDPLTPGALSWHVLWGPTTSFSENVRRFRTRFRV